MIGRLWLGDVITFIMVFVDDRFGILFYVNLAFN